LSAELEMRGAGLVADAFSTPTILHLCVVLFIAVTLSAPWSALSAVGLALDVCGLVGLTYTVIVVFRMRRQTVYVPVLEDWIWHTILPLIAYATLLMAAFLLPSYPTSSLFVVGGMALLLLYVGIHNAWDSVVYIALRRQQRSEGRADETDSNQGEATPEASSAPNTGETHK